MRLPEAGLRVADAHIPTELARVAQVAAELRDGFRDQVSVHEFGHGFGLAHDSYSTSVVMYPSIAHGQVRRTLHSRDQNGMRTLYP